MRQGMRRGTKAGACALAVMAVSAIAPGTVSAALSFGIHTQRLNNFEATRMARGGATSIRTVFQWRDVQPRKDGAYNWSKYDAVVFHAAVHGMTVLPVVIGSPEYIAKSPSRQPRGPEDLRRYQRFLDALVSRYGNEGDFWRTRLIPYTPVTSWQIWNEPNLHTYWAGELKPASYARFLSLSRDAIVAADPQAKIVLAGMPETKEGLPMSTYLKGLYKVKGFASDVDAVAAHSYATNAKGVLRTMQIERKVMNRNGDQDKPLWVTEIGWASAGPANSPLVRSEKGQARLLTASFRLLASHARKLGIGPVYWFNWRDDKGVVGAPDHFSRHAGLFTSDRKPKPAWGEFAKITGGDPGVGQIPPGTRDLGLGGLGDLP